LIAGILVLRTLALKALGMERLRKVGLGNSFALKEVLWKTWIWI